MHILLSLLILSVSFWITSVIVPGFQLKGGAGSVIFVAALFGVLHWLLGWLFFGLLVIGTFGIGYLLAFLTRWVVSAIVLKLTDALTDKLAIRSWGTALIAAAVMSLLGTLGQALLAVRFH